MDFLLLGIYLYKTLQILTYVSDWLYLCFPLALLHSVSYIFFLYRLPSSSLCTVFYSFSSNIDEVLSINPSANVSLETLTSIIRTWLPILVELIDLLNSLLTMVENLQIVNFLRYASQWTLESMNIAKATESPFSNELIEQHNLVISEILDKTLKDTGADFQLVLVWCVNKKKLTGKCSQIFSIAVSIRSKSKTTISF